VLVHKLSAPYNPEFAIGSIDESGNVYLDPGTRDLWDEAYLDAEKQTQMDTLRRWRRMYKAEGSPGDAAGRIAIVVDDGNATGSTMVAALRAVRARHPAKLIAATAIASAKALRLIRTEADQVVCLDRPDVLLARVSLPRFLPSIGRRSDLDAARGTMAARRRRRERVSGMTPGLRPQVH
jgi:predicted phosphoribosyltransferase